MSKTGAINGDLVLVRQLGFSYDGRVAALKGVSFSVSAGERLGLVGPNGAGKSTLFLCMTGVLRGFTGGIRVAGLSPADEGDLPELRRKVGLMFQSCDDQLFNPTVLEDVAFGPRNLGLSREEAVARAEKSLESVGLPPELYDRPPHKLSYGQKRRAALAGVLAMEPEILLLDEPGSDLDPKGKRDLIKLLDSLDKTLVISSHDLELVRRTCGRIIVLDGGKKVGEGPTDEVMGDAALMEGHGLEVPYSLRTSQRLNVRTSERPNV